MKKLSIFTLLIGVIFVFSCSGNSDVTQPTSPGLTRPADSQSLSGDRVLWSMGEIIFTPTGVNTADAEVIPLRGAEFNVNVQRFLSPPAAPVNLMTFHFQPDTDFPSGYVNVDVGISHPFPGIPFYTGFDVRAIFMADASTSGIEDSDLIYSKPDGGDSRVINPDGYTRWWNYPEFMDAKPLFSFKPGKLGTDAKPSATLNPFKYYSDDLGSEQDVSEIDISKRGSFTPDGDVKTRNFKIRFNNAGADNFAFNYAIDASWDVPDASGAPNYPVDSFPPGAQVQEAFHVSAGDNGSDAFYFKDPSSGDVTTGGNIKVAVEVYDWQAATNSSGVAGEINSIWLEGSPIASAVDGLPIATQSPGSLDPISGIFKIDLDESYLDIQGAGEYWLLGTVYSASPTDYKPQKPGSDDTQYPEYAALAAYFTVCVNVTGTVPEFKIITPNGGEKWLVGSDQTIVWQGADAYDFVKIEYSKDDFGSDIHEIVANTDNDGEFLWEGIPNDVSDSVKIRVSSFDYPFVNDSSDQYFAIIDQMLQRIVYSADGPASGRQIYSIDPEGLTAPEQWTSGPPAFIECPKLSPDGKYILYTLCDLNKSYLRLIDVETKEDKDITPTGYDAVYGDFSNDGDRVVGGVGLSWFGGLDLWTMDYNGENTEQLTTGEDVWAPSFNFDDSQIYYQKFSDSQVYIYDVALKTITQYTNNGTWNDDPVGNTDGTQIAWATAYQSGCRQVYISPVSSWDPPDVIINFDACVRSPSFSPDGTRVVSDHGAYDGSELAVYTLSDGTWVNITANAWGDYMADWGIMVPH